MNAPSKDDQDRALAFLKNKALRGKEKTDHYERIYRALLHSDVALSASQVLNKAGLSGTSANNISSKLNWLRRCGLAVVTKTGTSDSSERQVDMWEATEVVPKEIVYMPAKSWFLAFNAAGLALDVYELTEQDKKKCGEARERFAQKHAGQMIYRASES